MLSSLYMVIVPIPIYYDGNVNKGIFSIMY